MRAWVSGDEGFAGSWLRRSLEADGHEVYGFDWLSYRNVLDARDIVRAVSEFRPDEVFHLAAVARPAEAREHPRRAVEVNVCGALNVLGAVRDHAPEARVLLCGTSDEYGPSERTVTEQSPCFPAGPYGASKLAATALGMAYAEAYGLHVVVTRAWMHTGPGSPPTAAVSSLARKVVAVERGEADHVPHGDLSVKVDLTDVRDVVRAYRLAIGCEPGIYNVCREDRVSLAVIMRMLTSATVAEEGLLHRDPAFGAGTDMPPGSALKLHNATGWKPEIPLSQTLGDLLEYWRNCCP